MLQIYNITLATANLPLFTIECGLQLTYHDPQKNTLQCHWPSSNTAHAPDQSLLVCSPYKKVDIYQGDAF